MVDINTTELESKKDCPPCLKGMIVKTGEQMCAEVGNNQCSILSDKVNKGIINIGEYLNLLETEVKTPSNKEIIHKFKYLLEKRGLLNG